MTLGAVIHGQACNPEPIVNVPLSMMTRHGLIAGAAGTGKTRTLQLMAEHLSAAGVPVFLADFKGDLSGLAAEGQPSLRVINRARETGYAWKSTHCPAEFLSLTGSRGAQVRATISSLGPLLLSKILGLNDTEANLLSVVFKYCDDRRLRLVDYYDLRAVLQYLAGEDSGELKEYGGSSTASFGALLRDLAQIEQQGARVFFGEPEFDLRDLIQQRGGRGLVSILELTDAHNRPAIFSTFMLWMLARLCHDLPEIGDLDKPKLVFFFDEAHLLFENASKTFLDEIGRIVKGIRSKGIGIFFVTQNPNDVPPDILSQLSNRVQHALRALTPDDETVIRAAANMFPKTPFYDIQQTLTSLGIGEALVTVLSSNGVATPPFATRLIPPATRTRPLDDNELTAHLSLSAQAKKYSQAINRDSARKLLARRTVQAPPQHETAAQASK